MNVCNTSHCCAKDDQTANVQEELLQELHFGNQPTLTTELTLNLASTENRLLLIVPGKSRKACWSEAHGVGQSQIHPFISGATSISDGIVSHI